MNSIESAINLSIMSNPNGVQYIYDLANNNLSQEEKINTLRESITDYLFNVLDHGAYNLRETLLEDEIYESYTEPIPFISYEFLTTMFSSILHTVNWDIIINYHKEHWELDTR